MIDHKKELTHILNSVCSYYGITTDEAQSKHRFSVYVKARQFYVYLARQKTNATLIEITALINKDHSSGTYFIKKAISDCRFMKQASKELADILKIYERAISNKIVIEYIDLIKICEQNLLLKKGYS